MAGFAHAVVTSQNWFTFVTAAILIGLCGVAVALFAPRGLSSAELLSSATQAAIEYDEVYREALTNSDTSTLQRLTVGDEWAKVSGRILDRAAKGCTIETAVNRPLWVEAAELASSRQATVSLSKDWTQSLICPSGTTRISNGAFVIVYQLKWIDGRWLIATGDLE